MRLTLIISSIFLFTFLEISAQQYPFVNYTPKDGLVNSRVRKIYQDSKGRMYFLTYGGLSVYDGLRFKNYTQQNGISTTMINDVLEIGNDSLLVAVNGTQLHTLFNGVIGTLKTADGFTPLINQLLKSSDGTIYVSTDEGLFHLYNNRFENLPLPLDKNGIPPFLGSLVEFGDYLIFNSNDLRNFKGLFLYNKKTKSLSDVLPDIRVFFVDKDYHNRVWVGIPDKNSILDTNALKSGKLVIGKTPREYSEIDKFPVSDMGFDEQNIWIDNKGEEIVRIGNGTTTHMSIPQFQTGGVKNIFIDMEHNVWMSNDGGGILKLLNTGLRINENPYEKPVQYAFTVADTNWLSTISNKLIRKTKNEARIFTCNISPAPSICVQTTTTLLGWDALNVYEAEYPRTNESTIIFRKKMSVDTITFGKKMLTDRYGNLITAIRAGMMVWKNGRLISTYMLNELDLIEGMQFDQSGTLWVASRSGGLNGFSLHPDNPVQYLRADFQFPVLPYGMSPRAMVIDKKGLIWIGARSQGLFAFKLDGKILQQVCHYQRSNGLTDDFVTALACDSSNNIVVGTQTSVDRIVQANEGYYIENITKINNYFAYIQHVWAYPDNSIQALTATGALLDIPPRPKESTGYQPQLFIEDFKLNGQTVLIQKKKFSYDENNLSLSLAAPTFIDEKQIQFSYRLEGSVNTTWSDTTTNSIINLVNLTHGKYTLRIRAFFPTTPYPSQEIVYAFEIKPPWWQTWWFRLLTLVSVIAILVYLIRIYYTGKLEKQKAELAKQQAVERERTRIASDMHDDLGAGLSRIKFLSETIGLKKQQEQPIEEDINKIKEYSHEMIDKMGEIVWALNEKNDSLNDLLSYTRSFAVEYLSQSGINCTVNLPDQLPPVFVSGEFRRNIFLSVKESLHNIVKHAKASHVVININVNHRLNIMVQDNGVGFDRENTRPYSNGLTNIYSRMENIGGTAEIKNKNGTTVDLTAPLPL